MFNLVDGEARFGPSFVARSSQGIHGLAWNRTFCKTSRAIPDTNSPASASRLGQSSRARARGGLELAV
jgi:hypothetical protein